MEIAELMLQEQHYEFSSDAEDAFREYLDRRMKQPRFANGRSVRNALERARLRQANRIVQTKGKVGKKDLMVIEAEDILKSRLFEGDEADLYERSNGEESKDEEAKDEESKASRTATVRPAAASAPTTRSPQKRLADTGAAWG